MLSTTPENSAAGENGNGGLIWYLPAMISVVEEIERRGLDPDHGFARPGDGIGNVRQCQIVRAAERVHRMAFMRFLIMPACANPRPRRIAFTLPILCGLILTWVDLWYGKA